MSDNGNGTKEWLTIEEAAEILHIMPKEVCKKLAPSNARRTGLVGRKCLCPDGYYRWTQVTRASVLAHRDALAARQPWRYMEEPDLDSGDWMTLEEAALHLRLRRRSVIKLLLPASQSGMVGRKSRDQEGYRHWSHVLRETVLAYDRKCREVRPSIDSYLPTPEKVAADFLPTLKASGPRCPHCDALVEETGQECALCEALLDKPYYAYRPDVWDEGSISDCTGVSRYHFIAPKR